MSDATIQQPLLDDLADLSYVRQTRQQIINKLTNDGQAIPVGDKDQLGALSKELDAIDRSATNRMRLKQDEKKNTQDGQAQALIAQVLLGLKNTAGSTGVPTPEATLPPALPPDTVTRPYVDGEMEQGTRNVDPSGFV